MKTNVRIAVSLFVWALFTTASQAQNFGGGVSRPAVSPYLNLQRGGDPAINYYGLVRPQVAAARAFATLGNDYNALANTVNQSNQLVQTGHASSFMTQGRYFNTGGSRPAPATGGQTGGQAGGQPRTTQRR